MADEWIEHVVQACGGLGDESDDSEEDESWAGTKASLSEVEDHLLEYEQEKATEHGLSPSPLQCRTTVGSLKTQGNLVPQEEIICGSLKTRGYKGHLRECNLTGYLSSDATPPAYTNVSFHNSDLPFA